MTEPRKNKPEVIARANATRTQRMKDEGRVYARPKLECAIEDRPAIQAAGLAAMKRKYKQLTGN